MNLHRALGADEPHDALVEVERRPDVCQEPRWAGLHETVLLARHHGNFHNRIKVLRVSNAYRQLFWHATISL